MKRIIIITFCTILIIIFSLTTFKVVRNHQLHLFEVSEKRIIEAAKKCIYQKKCKELPITLEKLYDLNYLDKEINPITKEYFNKDSYIKKNKDDYQFVIID